MIFNRLFLFLIFSFFLSACGGGSSLPDTLASLKVGEVNTAIVNSASRGDVNLEVYLPPSWKKTGDSYPVIFFLHGSGGNEKGFFNNVDYQQLNDWIKQGELPPFVLIAIASHRLSGVEQQWSTAANETFFTSLAKKELRAFSLENFNAGDLSEKSSKVSIHGHSRGAHGALHYAFKFPDKFTSAVADAFVSDYALAEEQANALQNKNAIINSDIKIRMSVGDKDGFESFRHASLILHNYLNEIAIPHEYEVLAETGHSFYSLWNSETASTKINGLYELKLHAESW